MKRKLFAALLCSAMLTCGVTAYAETDGTQVQQETVETQSQQETGDTQSRQETVDSQSQQETAETQSQQETVDSQSQQETAETQSQQETVDTPAEEKAPELDDVISSLSSSPQGFVYVNGEVGEEITFCDIAPQPVFTAEWEGAEIVDFTINTGEFTDRNFSINDDNSITITPQTPRAHYTFSIGSITVEKDGKTCHFSIDSSKYGDGNFFAFVFRANEPSEPEDPSDSDDSDDQDQNESTGDPADQGGTEDASSGEESSGNDASRHEDGEAAVEKSQNVVSIGGASVTSAVEGVYSTDSIEGLAVRTSYEAVCTAAGLTAETPEGEKISLYVCDNQNKEEQEVFSSAAELLGLKVVCMVDVDMYHFTRNDCRTVKTLQSPVEITAALPAWAVQQGGSFSVLCADETGQLHVLPDLDTNSGTITVQTTCMGTYAIVSA